MISQPTNFPLLFANNTVTVSTRKLQNINLVLNGGVSCGSLFIGDVISTMKQSIISSNKIQAILSIMAQNISICTIVPFHKIIPAKDILNYPIIMHFQQAYNWIEQHLAKNINVLVHCHAGVSRSATIVISYLMKKMNWSSQQALVYLKQKRQRIRPNQSFWNQLIDYDNYLNRIRKANDEKRQRHTSTYKQNINKISLRNTEMQKQKILKKQDILHSQPQNTKIQTYHKRDQYTQPPKRRKIFQHNYSKQHNNQNNINSIKASQMPINNKIQNNSYVYTSPFKQPQFHNKSSIIINQRQNGLTKNYYQSPRQPIMSYYSPLQIKHHKY